VTGESRTPEQAPSEALSARLSDEGPRVGTLGGSGGLSGPQAPAQALDPRAVILDAISTTINAHGYWLPIEGKRAVADAVLTRTLRAEAAAEADRRNAINFQTRLDAARDWARRNLPQDQQTDLLRVLRGDTTKPSN
jgi:hypothetical protein